MLLLQLIINGLVNASIYSLIATGFGIVYRSTKIFHIVYAGFYTLSGYFFYTFFKILGLPLYISLLFTIIIISICGFLIEKTVYLPFYKRNSSQSVILIASLGIYIIIENFIALIFGNEIKVIFSGVYPGFSFWGIILTKFQIVQLFTGIIIILIFYILIRKVRIIKMLWAMGDEPELIISLGLPFYRLREIVFIVSSVFVCIASILTAIDTGIDPRSGFPALLIAVVSVIFGGYDSFPGWILGSLILAELNSLVIWKFSANWSPLVNFLILILILLTRPQGIMGTRKRFEEL